MGCAAAGVVAYKFSRPDAVPAKYTPPQEPMLVLVENYASPSTNYLDSQRLAAQLALDLTNNKVAPLVSVDPLYALRDQDAEAYKQLTIPDLGRRTGARQVLYINIVDLTTPTDGLMMQGNANVLVRVIDVATGNTRWPIDFAEGYPVSVQLPLVRADDSNTDIKVRSAVVRNLSDQIAKLLYTWRPVEGIE